MSNVFEFSKTNSLCNEENIYIYEYMLTFSPESWVCLGIQGHTPGAAPAYEPRKHTQKSKLVLSACQQNFLDIQQSIEWIKNADLSFLDIHNIFVFLVHASTTFSSNGDHESATIPLVSSQICSMSLSMLHPCYRQPTHENKSLIRKWVLFA